MHFLYFLVLCFASTIQVQTTIIITGNLKDFRSLAKRLSLHSANRIVETVQENDSTYTDEQTDDTVEDEEDGQLHEQHDFSDVISELIKHIGQKPSNKYSLKKIEPLVATKKPPTVLHLDDVVEKVKLKLLQEILAKSSDARKLNAVANTLVRNVQEEQTQLPSPVLDKDVSNKSTELDVEGRLVQTPVPMKVVKEEIHFEATYEEAQDKDADLQTQNFGEAHSPKPTQEKQEDGAKNVVPMKNKSVKKVRFVKQVVVPANLNQEQPSNVQQPSLNQQPVMQQPYSNPQTMVVEQPNLVRQLTLMQHQIDQINKTAQQKLTKETEDLEMNTEGANSESAADAKESDEKNADENAEVEDDVKTSKEEATIEEDQLTEENEPQEPTGTVEEEETPGEIEEDSTPDANETTSSVSLRSKVDKEESNAKIPTKDFGTPDTEQLSQKTNNFNGPEVMDETPVNFNLTLDDAFPGARKVMLL